MISRWPYYASVAVLGGESIACFLAGSSELGAREAMVRIDSAEYAEQARFAIELFAIGGLNLLALLAFLFRPTAWGWWLVLGLQVSVFVFVLIEGVLTDIGWFFFGGLPLLTFFLLLAFRKADARLKRSVQANLTPYLRP